MAARRWPKIFNPPNIMGRFEARLQQASVDDASGSGYAPELLCCAMRLSSLTGRLGTLPDQFAKHGPHSHRILRQRVGDDFSQYKEVEIRGDDPGSSMRAVSTLVDVTGRRNVEEELRR